MSIMFATRSSLAVIRESIRGGGGRCSSCMGGGGRQRHHHREYHPSPAVLASAILTPLTNSVRAAAGSHHHHPNNNSYNDCSRALAATTLRPPSPSDWMFHRNQNTIFCRQHLKHYSALVAVAQQQHHQQNQQQQLRAFHSSALVCDDEGEGMSAKDKKKKDKKEEPAPASEESPTDNAPATAAATTETSSSSSSSGSTASSSSSSASPPYTPPHDENGVRQYSYPELTADAARHKAGMSDPTRDVYQNPLHHNDPDHDGTKCFPEDFDTPEEFQANIAPLPPLDDRSGRVVAAEHIHALAEEMVNLTMLEMSELVNKIAEHYEFHEGMLSPGDGSAGEADEDAEAGGGGGAAAEQTAFDVKLVGFDDKAKIKIIKEARAIIPGLGLKEAKELIESAPVVIQKGLGKENAEEVKAKLEALGAQIEIV